jgi:hypothetical protein
MRVNKHNQKLMKRRINTVLHRSIQLSSLFVASLIMTGLLSVAPASVNPLLLQASAACITTAPPTTYGQVTQTVNVTTAGTYRVWSRIKAPDTTANSYYFEVDSGCAYNVGDATSIPANTWTWVNYQDGSTTTPIDVTLTAGSHTLTYTGKEANVQLDKVLLVTDTSCVPTGFGDNCAVVDTTSPTVSVTSPTAGASVNGTVNITATASDTSGISKVEFLVDGTLKGTDTTAAYSYSWDTSTATNGSHTITAKAYDAAGNVGTSTGVAVTVNNTTADTSAPTTSITAPAGGTSVQVGASVTINANATDNVGVTKVEFLVDNVLKSTDTTSPYSYAWSTTGVAPGAHALTVKAYDAANNVATSTAVSITLTSANIPGDVNGDGRVNALDLSSLISHDGQNYAPADFNHDGTVGAADMAILIPNWTW